MKTGEVLDLNNENFRTQTSRGIVLVDFYSPKCGPCQLFSPVLDAFADRVSGDVLVARVDVEKNPLLAAEFRVQSIPLLVFMKDGIEVSRLVGPRTVPELFETLEKTKN